ncbi:MAG: hypothetical protein KBS96_08805 [Lachnospiraceae bacterium]|nr:hypothetical protein [Candidatus Colinaster scatohippi]
MSIVGDVQLKVRTEVLREKSANVKTEIAKMNQYLDELETRLEGTKGYWIGEAGDLHRKLYKEQKDNVAFMMKRLAEHPEDLILIADRYDNIERENTSIGLGLPGDAID